MKTILCIILLILIVEAVFSPRIDIADGKVILWYGSEERYWIVLFKINRNESND